MVIQLKSKIIFSILVISLLSALLLVKTNTFNLNTSLDGKSSLYPQEPDETGIPRPVVLVNSIIKRGTLRVATRNAPTTYYHGPLGAKGFEYDLAKDFADYLGVDLEIVVYDNIADILDAVNAEVVDLAAAGITKTGTRQQSFLFGPSYHNIKQQVICNRDKGAPRNISDLAGRNIHVIAKSSYVERLKELAQDTPAISWTEHASASTEELIHDVADGLIECVVSDSNIVKLNQRYFPNIKTGLSITESQPLAWTLNKKSTALKQVIDDWFTQYRALGLLASLNQHYYQYVPIFDYVDIRAFHRRIDSKLPKFKTYFEQAAEKYNLDWLLLAAQSYQESHWNPKAKSPTGVRGMMMLTLPTAKRVGVKSRLDVKQSIDGGARYMSSLMGRLPDGIPEHSRIWFALAAYNVGMGHLYDARNLATKLGKDPNNWHDMQDVLPLLAKKEYYSRLRYGYARGSEPVEYVKRIRHYRDILEKKIKEEALQEKAMSTASMQ
ncbi:membrane-bound lytic murein transglycosylase MltF [Alkalimarinus alittae]|uniref:Membrane-bound lytic murein transglycosylase F n=1 Tax=Alkalimarinus alittae TaxID=2961619 RepID=A0ABY6N244_9ALTE|nr:membrane-bound lytic murein transglycosylase MltF [Alkalimarinus alittae]UZE96188.1 membrane-bound lytic murein transglycosylase MltF [Alkalimarinus alittae]